MAGDLVGEAENLLVKFRRDRFDRQFFERAGERMRKAVQTVSVADDGPALHIVENFPDLLAGVRFVIQE